METYPRIRVIGPASTALDAGVHIDLDSETSYNIGSLVQSVVVTIKAREVSKAVATVELDMPVIEAYLECGITADTFSDKRRLSSEPPSNEWQDVLRSEQGKLS